MEDVYILKIGTDEAVRNINDLKDNIKEYKAALNELEIGSEDYQNVLSALQVNQAALKNAMHGTAASMEEVARAAKGDNVIFDEQNKLIKGMDYSYNGLVKRMAELDQQFRATEDATKRNALGEQINEINNALKEMDAQRGKFGRNVGNYKSALEGLSNGFKATAGNAASVINPIANMTSGLKALSATPVIAILGLLANVLNKVMEAMSSSEGATNRFNTALAAFKPLADAAQRTLQAFANAIAGVVEWVSNLLIKWGLLNKELSDARMQMENESQEITKLNREYMVANAKLQAEADELRAEAAKKTEHTAKEREKMLRDAAAKEEQIFQNEVDLAYRRWQLALQESQLTENSKEVNDKLAQYEADYIRKRSEFAKTRRRLDAEIETTLREQQSTAIKTAEKEVEAAKITLATWDDLEKERKRREALLADARKLQEENDKQFSDFLEQLNEDELDMVTETLQAELDAEWNALEEEKRIKRERLATFMGYTSTLSDLSGAIADIYEADADADEKAAKKAKGFKIASAILSTLNGAVAAFTSTWSAAELTPTVKAVLAPMNAAAVLAAGYAQVKQMNSVKVGNDSSSAAVPAPAFSPYVAQVRNVTGQREEERLYQNQRVFLVYSDLEIANTAQRVKVRETEF